MLPAAMLREIGIEPTSTDVFELADGRRVEWLIGRIGVTVEGPSTPTLCICIFGPEHVRATLRMVVLESAGLTIEPDDLCLVRVPILS